VVGNVPVGKPHNIAAHPNSRLAYVGSQTPGKFSLVVVDISERKLVDTMALEKTPRGLEFSPDGRFLYITQAGLESVTVIEAKSNKVVGEISAGVSPHYANFTADGKRGLTAVQGPSLLVVFNPQTNRVEKSIKVGSRPHWVAGGPDGKSALTTNEGSNDVSVVDLESGAVATIPVGNAPRKIAAQSAEALRQSSTGRVTISGFAFTPALVNLKTGERAIWFNDDGAPHSIAITNGPTSDTVMPGQSFSLTFDNIGEFHYLCGIHPYMTGKVVVAPEKGSVGVTVW
jgi:YVTN family beta-propeller protein